MDAETENLPSALLWFFAPSRKLFEILRSRYGLSITRWGPVCLLCNVLFLFTVPRVHREGKWSVACAIAIWLVPFSRIVEIAYAFYNDALDQLAHKKLASRLTRIQRIKLLGLSYMEVAVCYASLYLARPVTSFGNGGLRTSFESLYFSWSTITTTGYGDFVPLTSISRALCMSEIGLGLMLIVLAVGTYLSSQE